MKVLFVYTRELPQSPVKPIVDFQSIQFGISHISSYVKQYGHQTRLLVMTRKSDFSSIDHFIKDFDPQLICCTAVASEYVFVEKIGRYIKERYSNLFLMIGGPHVSLCPDDAMLEIFDACCIGEGEEATFEVVTQLGQGKRPSGIANLWIRQTTGIEKNPARRFIPDLDALPNADRGMWMEWIDMERSTPFPSLLLGRGCPFLCTYCCNHALNKLATGTYVRFRSPTSIIGEIRELLECLPMIKEVYLEVETLGANIEWGLELCRELHEFNATLERPLSYGVNFRITPNMKRTDELFAALKKSNFSFINIGLESGSERVRRDVLRRYYSNEDILKAVNLARKNNLRVAFYNLIGLPTETIDEFKETIRMNRICLPDGHYLSIFYPYPGTDLYAQCKEKGIIPPDLLATGKERVAAALNYPEFSRKQIQKAYIWFDYYAYRDHKNDELLLYSVVFRYIQVYGGIKILLLPFIVIRDMVSPSLRFYPEYSEYILFINIPRVIFKRMLAMAHACKNIIFRKVCGKTSL